MMLQSHVLPVHHDSCLTSRYANLDKMCAAAIYEGLIVLFVVVVILFLTSPCQSI